MCCFNFRVCMHSVESRTLHPCVHSPVTHRPITGDTPESPKPDVWTLTWLFGVLYALAATQVGLSSLRVVSSPLPRTFKNIGKNWWGGAWTRVGLPRSYFWLKCIPCNVC